MNNYYFYELIETQFDNHKDPEITERVIGKYRDFDPARIAGYKIAKELEESERFKGWRFDHNNISETSVVFLAEKYDQKTKHLEQHAITIEKKIVIACCSNSYFFRAVEINLTFALCELGDRQPGRK